jgi:hypothetical protein
MTITAFEARINVDVKAFDRLLIEALAQDESEGAAASKICRATFRCQAA